MTIYRYRAKDRKGHRYKGTAEADGTRKVEEEE